MAGEHSQQARVANLLAGLRSVSPDAAWKRFLRIFSPQILQITGQFVAERERAEDCYLFVCEQLSDNGFRRLLQYRSEGAAGFRSWLNVVVTNLCIDWKRQQRGRPRPFKSITALPALERAVFRCGIQQGMSLQVCLATLQADFPDLDERRLTGALRRVNAVLTSRQRFLLSVRQPTLVSLDQADPDQDVAQLAAPLPGPEQSAERDEMSARLRRATGRLSARQRLLLRLRYEQELTLKEIARLLRLGDPFRARREIQAALAQIEAFLEH